jgi:hypothetical protein
MATRTKELVTKHKQDIDRLATELLVKETLDLLDIIRILGDRPFPLTDTMIDYMNEFEMRKKDKEKEDENKKKDGDKTDDDKTKDGKSDEFDKDKDLKEGNGDDKSHKRGGGGIPAPKDDKERDIKDAETVMRKNK